MTKVAAIETKGLCIGYLLKGGKRKVVHEDLNLQLVSGEVTCLLGLNGAGKSTLLRTLCGFQPPLGGEIRLMGKPLSGQEHWMDHLTNFVDNGVDGCKMDPARTIDEHPNFKYYNGHTDKEMHNLNQILLPKQMYKMMREHTGLRSWHHYTAGWSGTQHWSASTSGDNGGGRTALFDQLNLGMSGFLNTSCDVMNVNKDEELQSLHFGLFLPWVQINSWYSLHQPFYFPEKE